MQPAGHDRASGSYGGRAARQVASGRAKEPTGEFEAPPPSKSVSARRNPRPQQPLRSSSSRPPGGDLGARSITRTRLGAPGLRGATLDRASCANRSKVRTSAVMSFFASLVRLDHDVGRQIVANEPRGSLAAISGGDIQDLKDVGEHRSRDDPRVVLLERQAVAQELAIVRQFLRSRLERRGLRVRPGAKCTVCSVVGLAPATSSPGSRCTISSTRRARSGITRRP